MFEKVNPSHPDKIADRIAGAIVDLAYAKSDNPHIAVEVLIGHYETLIITESDVIYDIDADIKKAVDRITGESRPIDLYSYPQDKILHKAQRDGIKCGDNGIFKGTPTSYEEKCLTKFVRDLYAKCPTDGKFMLDTDLRLIVCQSLATKQSLEQFILESDFHDTDYIINPLGHWVGGLMTDCGATNRKLGSDMGRAITGGGLHGKDLSKADVTLNIVCHLLAQQTRQTVETSCAIGERNIVFRDSNGCPVEALPYDECVRIAKEYIDGIGGFEKFAEWGLIR